MASKVGGWLRANVAVLALVVSLLAGIGGWGVALGRHFLIDEAKASSKTEIKRLDTRIDTVDSEVTALKLQCVKISASLESIDKSLTEIRTDVRELRGTR